MSRRLGPLIAVAVAVAGAIATTGAEAATHPHDRNGFMIGFGVGGGSLGFEDDDSREGSVTANFRIGYAVRPDLVIHLETNGWAKQFDNEFVGFAGDGVTPLFGDVTTTSSNAVAAVTYHPPGSGLFLRGGLGFANVGVEVKTLGVKISDDENGLALLGALGYEWRLTKMFALAPQLEFTYQSLDTLGSSTLVAGGLGFNWYW
jgi:hypothetical protein